MDVNLPAPAFKCFEVYFCSPGFPKTGHTSYRAAAVRGQGGGCAAQGGCPGARGTVGLQTARWAVGQRGIIGRSPASRSPADAHF